MSGTVIIHGRSASVNEVSPRAGREDAELWLGYTGTHKDWTRRFDVHPVEHASHYHDGIKGKRPEIWEEYKALPPCLMFKGLPLLDFTSDTSGRPIYLLERHSEVSASVSYPLEWIVRMLGEHTRGRMDCSVSMMMALALAEGQEHIILHNVGLITDDWQTTALNPEWANRHKGILYWIGFAEMARVKVTVEGDSIFAPAKKVYGYETCGRDFGVAQRRYFTRGRG